MSGYTTSIIVGRHQNKVIFILTVYAQWSYFFLVVLIIITAKHQQHIMLFISMKISQIKEILYHSDAQRPTSTASSDDGANGAYKTPIAFSVDYLIPGNSIFRLYNRADGYFHSAVIYSTTDNKVTSSLFYKIHVNCICSQMPIAWWRNAIVIDEQTKYFQCTVTQ